MEKIFTKMPELNSKRITIKKLNEKDIKQLEKMMLNNNVIVSFEYIMILYLSVTPLIIKQLGLIDR